MALLSHPAFGPRASLAYITVGCLLDVWTAVWYFAFLRNNETGMSNTQWFWVVGLFLTGLTLIIIGMLLGQIGQAARRAEMPPEEAVRKEERIQQTAAANPNPVAQQAAMGVPAMPMAGQPMMPGQPGMPAQPVQAAPPAQQPPQIVVR